MDLIGILMGSRSLRTKFDGSLGAGCTRRRDDIALYGLSQQRNECCIEFGLNRSEVQQDSVIADAADDSGIELTKNMQ
jgi:hypothetical protein